MALRQTRARTVDRGREHERRTPPPPSRISRRYDTSPLRNRRSAFYPIPNGPTSAAAPPTGPPSRPQRRDVSQCPKMSHSEHVALSPRRIAAHSENGAKWPTMAHIERPRTPENACPGVRGACHSAQFAALNCPNDGHFRSFRPLSGNPGATVGSPSSWIPRTREL